MCYRILGYEGLEVVNPEGGTEDAEEEAKRGRWKKEVQYFFCLLHVCTMIENREAVTQMHLGCNSVL